MSESGTTWLIGLTEEQYDNITYNLCVNNYLYYGYTFGCNSTFFSTVNYIKVCGRLRGYTHGHGFSFYNYYLLPNVSISEQYLSGVSIINISGLMLMDMKKIIILKIQLHHVLALLQILSILLHYLLVMTITVNQDILMTHFQMITFLFSMIHYGLDKSVIAMRVLVVLLLICHGLSRH